ncbi:MAG: PorP/SprF family type IX secretion system membrane protein [Bacteroidota bacterium]
MARKLLIETTLLAWCFIGTVKSSEAQDAVFSQFFNSTLYLNPALAGIEQDLTVSFTHRAQWRNLNFPYVTNQFSLVLPYYRDKHAKPLGHLGGIGLSAYTDEAGENGNFRTTGVNGTFSYNLPLNKRYTSLISFGLQLGMIMKRIDPDGLRWGEQYNPFIGFDASIAPTELTNLERRAFLDINSGVYWFHTPLQTEKTIINAINAGLSVSHLNNPNESLITQDQSRLPLLYKFHGSLIFNLGHRSTISANILTAMQDDQFQNNLGSYLSYKITSFQDAKLKHVIARIGAWYRVNDSFIFLTEFETKLFKMAFSYDWNTSSLRYNDRSIGTYEIFLALRLSKAGEPKSRY